MTFEECFLCEKTTASILEKIDFVNITQIVPGSKRELRFVLEHLANCVRTKLIFGHNSETKVCSKCYNDLTDYDNLMVKLLASQKSLTARLQAVLSTKWKDGEEDVQNATFDDTSSQNSQMKLEEFGTEIEAKTENIIVDDDDVDDDEKPIIQSDVVTDTNTDDMDNDDDDDDDDDDAGDGDDSVPSEGGSILYEGHRRLQQECVVCGENFKSKLMLHKHITEMHNVKVFECKICGAVRKDEEYLELHMNLHEGKTEYDCRYCPKRFSRPVNTLRHMRKHWDKKEFQCEKCGERFSLDNMLYNHRLRHEAEENPLICSICNQSFKSRKTYNHHQLTHQKHRPRHQCPMCPKSFTERYTLKMHMSTHGEVVKIDSRTSDEAVKTLTSPELTCVVCGQKFGTKELLNAHLKDNHDVILNN